jgi:hypothetical protein
MGFFADIIRDSRRERGKMYPLDAPLSRGGEELPTESPAMAETGGVAPEERWGEEATVVRLREEGGGQPLPAGQRAVQSGAVTRQVVGLSSSEYTPVTGIPEATAQGVTLPDPVKREQAGCASDRSARGDFSVEQMESFHDGGSNDVPLAVSVGVGDSSVRKSSSGYAALRTGNVSVETQGRRQAGETRAGSTTPPDECAGEMQEEPFSPESGEPESDAPRQGAEPARQVSPASRNARQSLLLADRTVPTDQVTAETGRPAWEPSRTADDAPRSVVPPVRELSGKEPGHEPLPHRIPVTTPLSPPRIPAREERFHGAAERQLPALPEGGDGRGNTGRPTAPPEPRVRIGSIEVVVVAPAPGERPSRGEQNSRPDLASRHYLRNF